MIYPLFDRPEVDGLLHHLEVVRDAQSIWVDRIVEDLGGAAPPQAVYEAFGSLVPAIVKGRVCVGEFWEWNLMEHRSVFQDFGHFWALSLEVEELLIGHLLVDAVSQNGKTVLLRHLVLLVLFCDFLLLGRSELRENLIFVGGSLRLSKLLFEDLTRQIVIFLRLLVLLLNTHVRILLRLTLLCPRVIWSFTSGCGILLLVDGHFPLDIWWANHADTNK